MILDKQGGEITWYDPLTCQRVESPKFRKRKRKPKLQTVQVEPIKGAKLAKFIRSLMRKEPGQ